jgi:vanillate O-demethylase monooxygenase subunit
MGRIEGDCLRCMYHGMKYDPSGACIEVPGQDRIPKTYRVRSYPVEERGHLLWIWMGDPALADPDLIVDYPPLTDPDWRGLPAYLHYDANWLLIVDNLSDLGHLAFVHTNTLGGSEEYAYKSKPAAIERLENGFRLERWHRNSEPPPYHKKVIPASEHNLRLDRRNAVTMIIPGMFLMETMFVPAGSGAETGDLAGVRQYRNSQYMTPETRRTTHFFWNYLHNYQIHNPNIAISLRDSLIEGFHEDKAIIEAQQVLLDRDPGFRMRALEADVALTHFRQTLKKRIKEENEAQSATSIKHATG